MHRTCDFKIMGFRQLIPAVANKQIDIALSAMAITGERFKMD